MKTERFSRAPKPTPREITETLAGIKDATNFTELAAQEEGLSLEEYEKVHGKRKIAALNKEKTNKNPGSEEKYKLLSSWVYGVVPAELRNTEPDVYNKIVQIFEREAHGESFMEIWDYKIVRPEGLDEGALIKWSSKQRIYLKGLSRINLNPFKISKSGNVLEEVYKIENLIKSLKKEKEKEEIPSTEKYNSYQGLSFNTCVLNYLIKMIVIEKLEEILMILKQYEI